MHVSPDIQSKIDFLDDIDQHEEEQEEKERIRKLAAQKAYDVSSILDGVPVGDTGKSILDGILTKEGNMIDELVRFFVEQIKTIAQRDITSVAPRKRGRLNRRRLQGYISDDPEGTDIHKQRLYDKIETIEAPTDDYQKLDLVFAIDISGSMAMYKHNGMVHIIPTVLYVAMKHVEAHLRSYLDDPSYTIDVHFILYGDGTPYSSFSSPYVHAEDPIRMAEMNEHIHILTGGTNDASAWSKIAHEMDTKLSQDPKYTQEIKSGKRCPIVLQIADTDVTED